MNYASGRPNCSPSHVAVKVLKLSSVNSHKSTYCVFVTKVGELPMLLLRNERNLEGCITRPGAT